VGGSFSADLRTASAHVFVADLGSPSLEPDDAHHLTRVLRVRPGEAVTVSDGAGRWRMCRAGAASGRGVALEVAGPVHEEPPAAPAVTVAMAWPKGERADWAVQKLTEVGVDRVIPLVTDRGTVRWDDTKAAAATARMARIARQAAMQSRRVRLPEIGPPTSVGDALGRGGAGACAAEPGGQAPDLARPFVLVGPEGGWADGELPPDLCRVGLGPTVLRTETAAVMVAGVLCLMRSGLFRRS